MSLSILNIINRYVCPMASLPRFTALMSNNEPTALDIRAAIRMAGEEIARRAEWQAMYKTATVAVATSSTALPADFHRFIQGNAVALTATPFTPIPYIKSADVWSELNASPSSQPYFAVKNGEIKFLPALTGEARIRYISKNWLMGSSGELDEAVSDEDTPLFSDQLLGLGTLWRYKRAKGLTYQDWADEFEARLAIEIAADRGMT